MTENRDQLPMSELLKIEPQIFGLKLDNSNDRRSIFIVQNKEMFLTKAKELNIGVAEISSLKKYFEKFPDALVQFFVVNQPPTGKVNRLGDHYHTSVQTGGSGHEVFIFTEVPASTHITLEQYHLGKASGKLRYGVKSGEVMENQPNDYHVFTTDGSFQMVQVLEGGFKKENLIQFSDEAGTKGDKNVMRGRGIK